MRKITSVLFCLIAVEAAYTQCPGKPFALLELFSSEGCSSCPPADDEFNAFAEEMRTENVLLIDHHIDYWNGPLHGPCGRSAWRDPFGSPEATATQKEYREALHGSNLVTPQFVVQGEHASSIDINGRFKSVKIMVLSNLKKDAAVGICLKPLEWNYGNRSIHFEYTLSGSSADGSESLVCILYENDLEMKVTAGENCNRTLHHNAVRRNYLRIPIRSASERSGQLTMHIPAGVNPDNAGILAFIQDNSDRKALGGTRGFMLADLKR